MTITRHGVPAAVLLSPDEFESWQETIAIRADASLMREIVSNGLGKGAHNPSSRPKRSRRLAARRIAATSPAKRSAEKRSTAARRAAVPIA